MLKWKATLFSLGATILGITIDLMGKATTIEEKIFIVIWMIIGGLISGGAIILALQQTVEEALKKFYG